MNYQNDAVNENSKMAFESPTIEVIKIDAEDIICTSGTAATASNPFSGSTEEDW